MMRGHDHYYVPAGPGPISAIGDAESRFWAMASYWRGHPVVLDRTVISATLGDGRRGWVVGIEWALGEEVKP